MGRIFDKYRARRRMVQLALTIFVVALTGCSQSEEAAEDTASLPKVTIGIQVSPAMSLVMVAKDEGFFERAGVDVEIKEFTAGKFALQAFLSGGIDFAVSGEVPVALAALQNNPVRVVAQVVERTTNEVRVVANRDGDITDPQEYFKSRKRKLATSFGGGPEFFTYLFLQQHDIGAAEIEILSQKPEDMPAALINGSVDAIAIFDPFAYIAELKMGDKAITFADADLYSEFYVLDARPEQLEEKPEILVALLRALVEAGEFIEAEPERAKDVVQRYTKLDREIIDGIWENFVFRPALTQTLLDYWNAQAQWAKDTRKVKPETPIPDYRAILAPEFLLEVKPEAVQY